MPRGTAPFSLSSRVFSSRDPRRLRARAAAVSEATTPHDGTRPSFSILVKSVRRPMPSARAVAARLPRCSRSAWAMRQASASASHSRKRQRATDSRQALQILEAHLADLAFALDDLARQLGGHRGSGMHLPCRRRVGGPLAAGSAAGRTGRRRARRVPLAMGSGVPASLATRLRAQLSRARSRSGTARAADPTSQAAARTAPRAKCSRVAARWMSSSRSPRPRSSSVCSPGLSPPRRVCTAIAPSGRAPDLAGALEHAGAARARRRDPPRPPRPAATRCRSARRAWPAWCSSTISASKPGPRRRAASRASQKSTFTAIGEVRRRHHGDLRAPAPRARRARIGDAGGARDQRDARVAATRASASVAAGTLKSIATSQPRSAGLRVVACTTTPAPRSAAEARDAPPSRARRRAAATARSRSASRTCSPMRPSAPTTTTRRGGLIRAGPAPSARPAAARGAARRAG